MMTVTPVINNIISTFLPITTVVATPAYLTGSIWKWVQASVTGTGAVTATVVIQGSVDGITWAKTALATITLSGTNADSDGVTIISPVKYIRANVTAITGTGATLLVTYNG